MKKVLVILILAVYIASIAVVNFVGIQSVPRDSTNYVTSIQCESILFLGDNNKEIAPTYLGTTPLYTFDFISAESGEPYNRYDENNPNILSISWMVLPFNADKNVEFIYDEEAGVAYYHENSKSFIFMKSGMLDVIIKATDGSDTTTKITFWARSAEDAEF